MITGLEGIMGSGKSYEATVYHVLAALKQGRKVVTNLPLKVDQFNAIDPSYGALIEIRRKPREPMGTWDANRVDEEGNGNAFVLGPPGQVPDIPHIAAIENIITAKAKRTATVFSSVWDFYDDWRHPNGMGCLFVVDECHVPMPRMGTDPQVIEWIKLHRHFNQDIVLMTQNFRHMCGDIADVMAIVVKVRKADVLGDPDSYIRKVHAGFRGEMISKEIRKYKPEYFPLYKSHTQGQSVAEVGPSDVKPLYARWKKLVRVVAVITVIANVWAWWPKDEKKVVSVVTTKEPVTAVTNPTKPISNADVAANPVAEGEMPEPFSGKALHITGVITMGKKTVRTFAVSANAAVIQSVTDADLKRMGYEVEPFGDCAASLQWKHSVRAVTCDAPVPVRVAAAPAEKPPEKPAPPSITKM